MTNRDKEAENTAIRHLGVLADRLSGDRWMIESDDAGTYLISYRANGESVVVATFHKEASRAERELVAEALPLLLRFFDMFNRARSKIAELQALLGRSTEKNREGDYTTQASILTSDRLFWRFLETRGAGGPVRDKTAADTRLKSVLAIQSKKQLNENDAAKRAWLELHADYLTWKKSN